MAWRAVVKYVKSRTYCTVSNFFGGEGVEGCHDLETRGDAAPLQETQWRSCSLAYFTFRLASGLQNRTGSGRVAPSLCCARATPSIRAHGHDHTFRSESESSCRCILPSILLSPQMSHTHPTSTSSNFQLIFDNALEAYEKRTKKVLRTHPLAAQLQDCGLPTDSVFPHCCLVN